MSRKKLKKRQKLGEGYIWFSDDRMIGKEWAYTRVALTNEPDGRGGFRPIRFKKIGGWVKVKLFAEYLE